MLSIPGRPLLIQRLGCHSSGPSGLSKCHSLYPWDGASVVRSSTAFNSGASGGGLFNRADELIGILTFRGRGGTAPFFSLPVAWVGGLLGRSSFVAVAPQGPAPSFWEKEGSEQPPFLREFEEGLTGSPPAGQRQPPSR